MSGQRRITSERRLTRNQIVDAAVKIIGEGIARRADVQAIVEKMSKMCELSKRSRSRKVKEPKAVCKAIRFSATQGHCHDQKGAH